MGIYSEQSNQTFSFNLKILFFSLSVFLIFTSDFAYFLFQAELIQEYGISFYSCLSELYTLSDLVLTIWQMSTILKLIEMCEKFIEKSR